MNCCESLLEWTCCTNVQESWARVTCQMIFGYILDQLCLLDLILIKPAETAGSAANPFKQVFMSTLKMCEGSPSQANPCEDTVWSLLLLQMDLTCLKHVPCHLKLYGSAKSSCLLTLCTLWSEMKVSVRARHLPGVELFYLRQTGWRWRWSRGPTVHQGSILDQRACFMVLILTAIRSALSGCKAGGEV